MGEAKVSRSVVGRPRRGAAEKVASWLKSGILRGRFRPGDALPSERQLAARYEVNRSSVREALKRLEAWGLVEIRHGGATRVRDFLLSAGLELLPHLVEGKGGIDPVFLRDLHEMRAMILGWCAERAAERADAQAITSLEALVERLSDPKARPATLQELDYDFFEALARISENRLLMLFSNVVREIYLQLRGRFLAFYAPGVFEPAHHRKALSAIRRSDGAAARRAMYAHAFTALYALEEKR